MNPRGRSFSTFFKGKDHSRPFLRQRQLKTIFLKVKATQDNFAQGKGTLLKAKTTEDNLSQGKDTFLKAKTA
jgi:hypothetical protein